MAALQVKTMAQFAAEGKHPEVLFWVGCSGSFDDRAKKITRAFVKILNKIGIEFAVLGSEESCNGDPAKRAGNEFLFQTQAMMNIEVLNGYEIKNIVTICPHCFNILKNEYPSLGGNYEVLHHSEYLQKLINEGRLVIEDNKAFKGKKITFHDPCYLGRGNGIFEAPRTLIEKLDTELVEMKHCRERSLCCGSWRRTNVQRTRKRRQRHQCGKDRRSDRIQGRCDCNRLPVLYHYDERRRESKRKRRKPVGQRPG